MWSPEELPIFEKQFMPGNVSIVWMFASTQSSNTFFREAIARGEEAAGKTHLAQAIRSRATTYEAPSGASAATSAAVIAEDVTESTAEVDIEARAK